MRVWAEREGCSRLHVREGLCPEAFPIPRQPLAQAPSPRAPGVSTIHAAYSNPEEP